MNNRFFSRIAYIGLLWSILLLFPVMSVQAGTDALKKDQAVWAALEKTTWIADGNPKAPRIIYVFTDPDCPYCNTLWRQARPWVASDKVQMRHIMLGMVQPTSLAKAVNLLNSDNPSAALHQHEMAVAEFAQKHGGKVRPTKDKVGVEPATTMPQALVNKIEANMALAHELGVQGTPALVWQNPDGSLSAVRGVPREALEEVFGPL